MFDKRMKKVKIIFPTIIIEIFLALTHIIVIISKRLVIVWKGPLPFENMTP
jgi:hypothetical protein